MERQKTWEKNYEWVAFLGLKKEANKFDFDSGASHHIVCDKHMCKSLRPYKDEMRRRGGFKVDVHGIGTVKLQLQNGYFSNC